MKHNGIWFKGKFIEEGASIYAGTSNTEKYIRGGLPGLSRTIKAGLNGVAVCVKYETI